MKKKPPGLYANIQAKRARGEKMRKPGEEGAPTAQDFKNAAKTAKKNKNKKREDPGGNMKAYFDTPKMKRGMKREDPKGDPAGYYDSNKKKKKKADKSPYADGMGKKCTCDSIAEEFNAVLDTESREDKPCGNSFIPERAKCEKGRGTAKRAASPAGSIRGRAKQGAKLGGTIGAGVGAAQGAAAGAALAGPAGALAGALGGTASGYLGGLLQGGAIGAGYGAAEKAGRALRGGNKRSRNTVKPKKRKAKGMSPKELAAFRAEVRRKGMVIADPSYL